MRFARKAASNEPNSGGAPRAGFTLAEVMAALVFMAIVIPVALGGLGVASRAGEVAARKSEAALVAERILMENIVTTNTDVAVQTGTTRQGIRDFKWTMRSEPWNLDGNLTQMRLLSVEVTFTTQGRDYPVRMSTLIDNASPFEQTNSMVQ